MANHSVSDSLRFAVVLAAIAGVSVAAFASVLRPRIEDNQRLERRAHILRVTGLIGEADVSREQVNALYSARVSEELVEDSGVQRPWYRAHDAAGTTTAVCLPVEGAGLWGPIRGYVAVDAKGRHIIGATFYEHRETPGLGSAITSRRWTDKWRGKRLLDDSGQFVGVRVLRGAIDPRNPDHAAYAVDGISGATITSRAVESLVGAGFDNYRTVLEERWRN